MSPGFKIFQTKPQGNVCEITLQNGQSMNFSSPSTSNPWPDALLIRMNNKLHVAFYETGIALIITAHERPTEYNVDFEIRVPRIFQRKTKGFLGNLDGDPTNEFCRRSGMNLTQQPDGNDDFLFNVLQSCKFYRLLNFCIPHIINSYVTITDS